MRVGGIVMPALPLKGVNNGVPRSPHGTRIVRRDYSDRETDHQLFLQHCSISSFQHRPFSTPSRAAGWESLCGFAGFCQHHMGIYLDSVRPGDSATPVCECQKNQANRHCLRNDIYCDPGGDVFLPPGGIFAFVRCFELHLSFLSDHWLSNASPTGARKS